MSNAKVALAEIINIIPNTYNTNEGWVVKKMRSKYANRIAINLPIIWGCLLPRPKKWEWCSSHTCLNIMASPRTLCRIETQSSQASFGEPCESAWGRS
jgi:hypothetical protein